MELAELAQQIAVEARQIQADLQQLKDDSGSNQSVESAKSKDKEANWLRDTFKKLTPQEKNH